MAVACKADRKGYDAIIKGNTFTLNVVGDKDTKFMKYFWSGYDEDKNPFNELEHTVSENDGIIISAAKSVIECKMISKIVPGDHEIIIAEVIGSYVLNEESSVKTHVRKSGLDY